jgi:glycosyltransferase involved in cell wall biosynthesis
LVTDKPTPKLAIVIPGFQADERDWCIPAFTNLAAQLAQTAQVHVFALRYPHARRRYSVGKVHVHATGGGALAGRRVWALSLLGLWRQALADIWHEHLRSPFSIVMGIWATESGWLATRAARRLGVPSLVHIAGGELVWLPQIRYGNMRRSLAGLLVRSTLKQADCLTVPSRFIKHALLHGPAAHSLRASVEEWAPGVDTALFTPADGPHGGADSHQTFTFVTAGSLIPVKQHSWLLEAMAVIKQAAPECPVRLQIAGAGPLMSVLLSQVVALQLQRHVDFLGEVPHHALPDLYRQAHCFVLGSLHEAQCMAVLEAMACGLPWVGPAVGALADIAATGPSSAPTGIAVQERTPEALARAMLEMMHLPDATRRQWGMQARRRIVANYQLGTQTSRLLSIMLRLSRGGLIGESAPPDPGVKTAPLL